MNRFIFTTCDLLDKIYTSLFNFSSFLSNIVAYIFKISIYLFLIWFLLPTVFISISILKFNMDPTKVVFIAVNIFWAQFSIFIIYFLSCCYKILNSTSKIDSKEKVDNE